MANSNTTELFEALTLLAKEKGIDPAVLIEKIQTALVIAIKKEYPRSENIKFDIDKLFYMEILGYSGRKAEI